MDPITTLTFEGWLHPGETVLWFGRPGQGIILMPRDMLLVPFSLVWGGFALAWETMALSFRGPGLAPLFGIPFVLVGFFLVVGRFLLDAWMRTNTAYAVTEQRILILRRRPWPSFRAVRLDRLPGATLNEESNGRGTIRFGEQASMMDRRNAGFGLWVASLDPTPQFIAVQGAKDVFALAQERFKVGSSSK